MGILNVTPDSFSDGGCFFDPLQAVQRARQMKLEGADILDIGGESTRPGARAVDVKEEWRRLSQVLQPLAKDDSPPISVDTRNAETARLALGSGVEIINDVSCARNPELLRQVAKAGAAYVLMHSRGDPSNMVALTDYHDLISEVLEELRIGLDRALQSGIEIDRVCVDPGFGFAKTLDQNWSLLEGLDRLGEFGRPVLVGLSRKRMLRERVGDDPDALLTAGLSVAGQAVQKGARILRVHDVAATRDFLQVLQKS